MLKYVLGLYRYQPGLSSRVLCLMALSGLLEGVGLLLLLPLLSLTGMTTGRPSTWWAEWMLSHQVVISMGLVLCLFVFLVVLSAAIAYWNKRQAAQLQLGFSRYLADQLYTRLMRANWRFLSMQKQADFSNLFAHGVSRVSVATQRLLQFLSTTILVLAYLVVALYLSWQMTAIVAAVGLVMLVLLLPFYRRAYRQGEQLHHSSRRCHEAVMRFWHGLKVSKSFAVEQQQVAMFAAANSDRSEEQYRFMRSNAMSVFLFQASSAVVFAVVFFVGWDWLHVAIAELLVLLLIFARLLPKLNGLQRDFQQLLNVSHAYVALQSYFQEADRHAEAVSVGQAPTLQQAITLQQVEVHYQGDRDVAALKAVDVVLPAQKTTVLVGPSGAGKSTLADVLAGLLHPDSGEVFIDDTLCDAATLQAWRTQVGYMTQEAMLFDGTVRDNLLLGSDYSDQDIWQALEQAQAGFVETLPEQLDALVGDRGMQLSGGERQRLALARVLLRQPQLLILDEATSQIDQQNESLIKAALQHLQGHMTIIIVTHRPSLMDMADQVIYIEDGCIVDSPKAGQVA